MEYACSGLEEYGYVVIPSLLGFENKLIKLQEYAFTQITDLPTLSRITNELLELIPGGLEVLHIFDGYLRKVYKDEFAKAERNTQDDYGRTLPPDKIFHVEEWFDYRRTIDRMKLVNWLHQGHSLEALVYYKNHPDAESVMAYHIGNAFIVEPHYFKETIEKLEADENINRSKIIMGFLQENYTDPNTQKMMANFCVSPMLQRTAGIGVDKIIPLTILENTMVKAIGSLRLSELPNQELADKLSVIKDHCRCLSPAELQVVCQQEPLMTLLDKQFGTHNITTADHLIDYKDKFPVQSKEISLDSIQQKCQQPRENLASSVAESKDRLLDLAQARLEAITRVQDSMRTGRRV